MAQDSKIEWTDHTVNLWWGCSKVHTGCKNCYADALSHRLGNDIWGKDKKRKRIKSAFSDLDKYQRQAAAENKLVKVFVGSMMDIFEAYGELNNPIYSAHTINELRTELFRRISDHHYDNILFLFLTKRPENIDMLIPEDWQIQNRHNVWLGTSVSDQKTVIYADVLSRMYYNMNLFLSIEPQVGPINNIDLGAIKWVIQGGESGPKKRPFNLNWAYWMKRKCLDEGVPYFFKQIDKVKPIPNDLLIRQFPEAFSQFVPNYG